MSGASSGHSWLTQCSGPECINGLICSSEWVEISYRSSSADCEVAGCEDLLPVEPPPGVDVVGEISETASGAQRTGIWKMPSVQRGLRNSRINTGKCSRNKGIKSHSP